MPAYGISSWIVAKVPVDEAIEHLAASCFDQVELSADESALVKAWEADPEGICGRLADEGLTVPSIHSPGPGRSLDAADSNQRQASIDANLRYFESMHACGIPEIVIHPTSIFSTDSEQERKGIRTRSVDSLARRAERAAEFGLRMAVENLARPPTPASTIASILEMIDGFGDHVGVCHDMGHSVQGGLDIVEEVRTALASRRLFSLHIHDVNAELRDHFIPGEGNVGFSAFLDELGAAGFAGGRILEISPPAEDVAERLEQVAAVRCAWEGR